MKKWLRFVALGGAVFWLPLQARASSFSIESIGSQLGLGDVDIKTTAVHILNLVLGFLPLVALVMIMLGGFTWLTSGGNEERVDRAKKTISAAVIGMVLVLLAWAVVSFFAKSTANMTA